MADSCSTQRKHLTLKQKIEVIQEAKKNPKLGVRGLCQRFNCGKTQIATVLKEKEQLLALYESNASDKSCKVSLRTRKSDFSEVNEVLYKWYLLACSKNIYPAGPQLVVKAKEIAERLGRGEFKGSNGWLEKWKRKYNIKQLTVSGESGDVSGATVDSWKEQLPEVLQGYAKRDIWNLDETGVFWKALPERGFVQKGRSCKGGKKSKQRFTIAFIANADGGKEKPVVIWKYENPRCFKNLNKSLLPVSYFSQSKVWMTGDILDRILKKINQSLRAQSRFVALLMDNAGCHPPEIKDKYSNVKVVFLPANTTSRLQPLDLGIIKNVKFHYRQLFLQYVLTKIEECDTASQVAESLNVLKAIHFVSEAWEKVKPETICKCFRSAGVLDKDLNVTTCNVGQDDADPFLAVDSEFHLNDLIPQVVSDGACSVDEYLDGDGSLPVCRELSEEHWEEEFLAAACSSEPDSIDDEEDCVAGDVEMEVVEAVPKIDTFKDAMKNLEDVQLFLQNKGFTEEALKVGSVVTTVARLYCSSLVFSKQTTLDSYFSKQSEEQLSD